jgi:2-keto-4-pentenoate hydratase/2-oxohepta-3-ene-1,7-dioic acid hydratase in catechol pathway
MNSESAAARQSASNGGQAREWQAFPTTKKRTVPLAHPSQVICGGMSYAAHNKELSEWIKINDEIAGLPWYFVKAPRTISKHGVPIELPDISPLIKKQFATPYGQVTGEVELGIVIKDRCHRLKPSEVRDHILGYTIFNDLTQRDMELAGYPICAAKGFHTFGPVGPHMVPAEDIDDPQALRFELRVNGTAYQKGALSEMLYSIETLVSQASQIYLLDAGDIVTTGSPPGMFDYHLQPGDVIEAEIENIGVLRNTAVLR